VTERRSRRAGVVALGGRLQSLLSWAILARMKNLPLGLGAVAVAVAVMVSGPARADVAPPDQCNNVGTACSNAGDGQNPMGVGICTAEMCPHEGPDGGTIMIACTLCEPMDGGAGGASGTTSTSTTSTSTTSTGSSTSTASGSTPAPAKSGGCAVGGLSVRGEQDGLLAFSMLALGAGALAWQRRRGRR
jgi:hypothetical protein